jgi:hypothetical protein
MGEHYYRIVHSNIFEVKADVLAFSANPLPMTTVGKLDTAVFLLAGRDELIAERKKHGILEYGAFVNKNLSHSANKKLSRF